MTRVCIYSQAMKLTSAHQIRDRVIIASTVSDPTGLEIVIPQASQSTSDFMFPVMDSSADSEEDSWITDSIDSSDSSWAEGKEEERREQHEDAGTCNAELINLVRVEFMQYHITSYVN